MAARDAVDAAGLVFQPALIEAIAEGPSAAANRATGPGEAKPAAANHRNGGSAKTVLIGGGKPRIATPRNRGLERLPVPRLARRFACETRLTHGKSDDAAATHPRQRGSDSRTGTRTGLVLIL